MAEGSVAWLHYQHNGFLYRVEHGFTAACPRMEAPEGTIPVLPQSEHQILVGRRLRQLITELNLSFVQAAKIMGVSKHVLNHWMAGNSYPQPYAVYRLARLKHADFNYAFLGDWSALRSDVAQRIEAQALAKLEASQELAHQPAESDEVP